MPSVEVGGKLSYLYPLWLLRIHHWFLCQRFFVAWASWTKHCVQNVCTSHSNDDCHYDQKNENLLQSESESNVQRFLTLCLLISESVVAGKSSWISKCIIAVDMAPSEPLDPANHKMLYSSCQMIILFIQFL